MKPYRLMRLQLEISKLFRKMIRLFRLFNVVKAYKDKGLWYVKDLNGFSKEDNLFVMGVPELIEGVVGKDATLVKIKYEEKTFPQSLELRLVHSDYVGSTYEYDLDGIKKCCLCPVFFWYFPKAPDKLYVKITKIN